MQHLSEEQRFRLDVIFKKFLSEEQQSNNYNVA